MYAHGFRFYFTPLSGVLFAFPSRYWFTIGQSGVFSLGGWSPHIQTGFHVPRPTLRRSPCFLTFVYGAITLYWPHFPEGSTNTQADSGYWADPRSLAATEGISVDFFSSGYLDVSVPRVRFSQSYVFSEVIACPLTTCTNVKVGFPIRKSPDQSLFTAPRRFSQLITSFIASDRQGIHRVRLVTLEPTPS